MNTETLPTAASLLIDALTPAQRAMLHNALIIQQHAIADEKHSTHDSDMQPVLKERCIMYYDFVLEQNKLLCNQLFAECFIDDLEPLQHFVQQHPHLKPLPTNVNTNNSFS